MVRQRMTVLDIKASVDELRSSLVGLRLQNIYDITPKVFLLKFGQGDKKVQVLIESGVRIHSTTLTREKPMMPSQFTLKLRKHVRSWRLDAIEQVGLDRAVDFRFGTGEGCHHFVVEFFGRGNFLLTDSSYTIMMLLRSHKDGGVEYRVREKYTFPDRAATFSPATPESVTKCLVTAKPNDKLSTVLFDCGSYGAAVVDHVLLSVSQEPKEMKKNGMWEDKLETLVPILVAAFTGCNSWFTSTLRPGGFLVAAVATESPRVAQVADLSAAATAGADQQATMGKGGAGLVPTPQLLAAAAAAGGLMATAGPTQSFETSSFAGSQAMTIAKSSAGAGMHFMDFMPVPLKQYVDNPAKYNVVPCPSGYGTAAERFFLPMEQDRIEAHNVKKENVTLSTRDKCLRDHQKRIDKLLSEEDANRQKGDLLQFNADEVEEAMELIRMAVGTKISWEELRQVLKARQREGHPVANMIHDLHLERNSITVLLCDPDFSDGYYNEDDEEPTDDESASDVEDDLSGGVSTSDEDDDDYEESRKNNKKGKRKNKHHYHEAIDESQVVPVAVEVDLGLTAYSNAGRYFDWKKAKGAKLEKTIAATDKAVAGAERKGSKQAEKKGPAKKDITDTRVPMWFEKFYWFMTSFGHMVVAARDSGQADTMVKRYMKPGDFFVHSDAEGGLPCLVKNPAKVAVPMGSLEEAGTMAVCRSKAWESKMSVSAWWVHAVQVSKNIPGGGNAVNSYLAAGLYHIKGKKNFLPAMPLQLGCALLFRTKEEHSAIASHVAGAAEGGQIGAAALEYVAADLSELALTAGCPSTGGKRGAPGTPAIATPSSAGKAGFPATALVSSNGNNNTSPDQDEVCGMGERMGSNEVSSDVQSSSNASSSKKKSAKDRRVGALRPKASSSTTPGATPTPSGGGVIPQFPGGGSDPSQSPSGSQIPQLRADSDDEMPLHLPAPTRNATNDDDEDDQEDDEEDEEGNDADESSAATTNYDLERKKKKHNTPAASGETTAAGNAARSGGEGGSKPATPGLGLPKSRRQANKLKKINKKYGEQDEDDRLAAMSLLGNKASKVHKYSSDALAESSVDSALKGGKKKKQQQEVGGNNNRGKPSSSSRELAESPIEEVGDISSVASGVGEKRRQVNAVGTPETEQEGESSSASPTTVVSVSHDLGRPGSVSSGKVRFAPPALPADETSEGGALLHEASSIPLPQQHSQLLPVTDEDHDRMRKKKEETIAEEQRITERMLTELESELPHLTGKLADEEVPSYCYAIIAPYSALLSYLFKVKLTPGHDKRGQAAKAALASMSQQVAHASPPSLVVAPLVKQVLQRVPLEEATQQFAANVKVHIPEIKIPHAVRPRKSPGSVASSVATGAGGDMGLRTASTASSTTAGSSSAGKLSEKKRKAQLFKDAMKGLTV